MASGAVCVGRVVGIGVEVFLSVGVGPDEIGVGEGMDVESGVFCGMSTSSAVGIWVAVAGGSGVAAVTGMSVGA